MLTVFLGSELLHPKKDIEMDFFIKPDGYGPCIQCALLFSLVGPVEVDLTRVRVVSYAIEAGPGSIQVMYIGGSFAELAEKARVGLHRRPTLRTPSGSASSRKSFCCAKVDETSEAKATTEKRTYDDKAVQTDPIEAETDPVPIMEKETATALAVVNVAEPGDEQVVKNLDVPPDVPLPENGTHTQARSDFR